MSGSDRYLSMSLDDIIKIRKKRGTNRSSSVASSSRSRGAQNQRFQRGTRGLRQGSQRGYGQLRGQSLRGRQQVTVSQRGFRGNQRRGLRTGQGRQVPSRQEQAIIDLWPSYQSVASTQSQRRGRGMTRGGARPRGLPRLPVRAQVTERKGIPRPRGPQVLSAAQLARNRVRLAAQILMQRRQQLQQIQMPSQALNSLTLQAQPRSLRGVSSLRRRGRVYRGRLPASTFSVQGARRGAFINKMAARASLGQKMARARRNRELVAPQLLSVSIDNERALAPTPVYTNSPVFSLPQLMVVTRQPPSLFRAPATVVRRRGRGGVPRAAPVVYEPEVEVQEEEEEEPIVVRAATPGRRLTLNERFSQC